MSGATLVVTRSRLFLSLAVLLSVVGALAWGTMPRQEDPEIPARAALIVVPLPGASALTVERLVLEPLEDALSEVDTIKVIHATARTNVAVVVIELRDEVTDVQTEYDEVERQLRIAEREFPDTAGAIFFDRHIFDQESIVLALTGDPDPMVLRDAAERLERRLLTLRDVSRVFRSGDPGVQVTIALDPTQSRRLGLDPRALAGQLASRNTATPGGAIVAGGRTVTLEPQSEFESLDALARTPVTLASGASLPLSEVAAVRLGPTEPAIELMRLDGAPAIALGIVPRSGVHLIHFGHAVTEIVDAFNAEGGVAARVVAYQPDRVEARLRTLSRSLLSGVAVVGGFLFLFMGFRLGLTVAAVVPLVTASALGVYALSGGVLHQMSIAALVLALGLLVDAAIVVAEDVQARLDRGQAPWVAAQETVATLAVPLGAATGTTVAAFVPMLLAQGPTGDFTRSLPIVITITLGLSYLYAVTVTPALAAILLRPVASRAERPVPAPIRWMARASVERPVTVVVATLALVLGSLVFAPGIRAQFFPPSDRNELVVDVVLPEGAHLSATDGASRVIEQALARRDDVVSVAAFVGRGVPHFYYNLVQKPQRPHLAQLLVTTRSPEDVDVVIAGLRAVAREALPGVVVIGQRIEQGPPVSAPVEIRVYGDDRAALARVSSEIRDLVRAAPGATDVRTDLSLGVPALRYRVDDAVAARSRFSRLDVALALLGQTRGLPVGELRYGEDPIPVVVRGPSGETATPADLSVIDVSSPGVPPTPLAQLALEQPEVVPAALPHRHRQRVVSVYAQVAPGSTYSDVLAHVQPGLDALALPPGVRVEIGGDAEASEESNAALMKGMPIGMLLLVLCLMGEFNSFRQVGIVLATVPLAAIGILPGLALTDQPFGFMSMLGVFALVGIVVNNAIVLLDVIGARRSEGATIAEAVQSAVALRVRPILLTTGTTVAGLLPLALSSSTMWPPLAWAMISGLTASTLLTLIVIPALYRVLYR